MKNFMMRGVILAALLSSLILPASADFSSTDSTNLSNIKSYAYDIKTAVTSGTLFTNVSAIKSSVANISSNVANIYTQIQAVANSTSSISSKAGDIYTALGYNSSYSSRKVIPLLYNISEYLRTIDDDASTLRTTLSAFQNDVNSRFSTVTSNQAAVNTNLLAFKNAFSSYAGTDSGNVLGYLSSLVSTSETLATEETLQTLATEDTLANFANDAGMYLWNMDNNLGAVLDSLTLDTTDHSRKITLFGYVQRLSDFLASDNDRAIRDSQKSNISQVKESFVSGSSSGTSLGASDFGSLSAVSSTFKDLSGLNGQASVGSLTDGLTAANTQGQGWFSESTRVELDAVTSPVAVISFDDPDPYNMGNFTENYSWVFGGASD